MPKKKKNERAQDIAQPEQAVTLIPDEERGPAPVDDVPAVAAPEVAEESAAPVAMPSEEEGAPVDGVIRIGETAEGVKKLNGFDRFWIKVWSYIVSAFNAMARGINFVIEKIFKKRVPDRYIIAVLATIVVILLMLLVTAPFKITVNDVEEMQLYNSGLTPVQQRVGTDPVSGYPVYKWGYANESGRIVIDCRFDNVTEFKHGVAFVNVVEENEEGIIEDYWYLIDDGGDRRGEIRIVADTSGAIPVGEFGDEVKLAPVYIGGKYGFMNTRGDMQISATYDEVGTFVDGFARVRKGGNEYFIDRNDKALAGQDSAPYQQVRDFCDGYAAVKKNNLWSFIDTHGDVLTSGDTQLVFDKVTDFTMGYALVKNGTTLSVIDQKGNFVISGYQFNDLKVAEKFDTSWW